MAVLRTSRLFLSTVLGGGLAEELPADVDPKPGTHAWGPRVAVYTCPAGKRAVLRSMTAVYLGPPPTSPLPALYVEVSPWEGANQGFYYWVFGGVETGFMSTSLSMWVDLQLVLDAGERLMMSVAGAGPVAVQGTGAVMALPA